MQKIASYEKIGFGIGVLVTASILFYLFAWPILPFPYGRSRQSSTIIEQHQSERSALRLQITAYAEENAGLVPGAYYKYESFPTNSNTGTEIFTVRHDDPVPIVKESAGFISENTAYVYMRSKYAATTDGGSNWCASDLQRIPSLEGKDYEIKAVNLSADGTGAMTIASTSNSSQTKVLTTANFGCAWE